MTSRLREWDAGVLCCHGYKADIVGLLAARRARVPVIAMSHGWTAETWKVRLYEALDRVCLRRMDRVICVSEGQAGKVRGAGVRPDRVIVIRNAVRGRAVRSYRSGGSPRAGGDVPSGTKADHRVGRPAQPRKGVRRSCRGRGDRRPCRSGVAFIHFGDGPLRETIRRSASESSGLKGGSSSPDCETTSTASCPTGTSVCSLLHGGPSHRGARIVCGGSPCGGDSPWEGRRRWSPTELTGSSFHPVTRKHSPADPRCLWLEEERIAMGRRGRERIRAEFSFDAQAARFQKLCNELTNRPRARWLADSAVNFQASMMR